MVAFKPNNLGMQWRDGPVGGSRGWPCANATAKIACAVRCSWGGAWPQAARKKTKGRATMPIVTWDHIHLRSPDPEATAAWLEDLPGSLIIRGPGRIDVKLGGANVFIAPVAAGDGVNTPPVTPYQGLDHFGLTVKD